MSNSSTTPSASPLHVLIIGAGTGGLCLAHGLKRAGISVAVYERDRTRADGLHGYRVGIDADGSRALHACLPPDLFATFVATCARDPKYFNIVTEDLSEVLSLPLTIDPDAPDRERSVSRMTLRQVLLTGLDDIVHFDKVFSRYEQQANGTVTAFFEDGSSATGDVLVAADGTNSRVRRQYLPHARLEDSGILAIGGKLPLTPETAALLPPTVLHGISMVLAPKGYSCILHVMEFKWDHNGLKAGLGDTDADLIAGWPGLLYDNTTDYIMWGFAAARHWYAADPLSMRGEDLIQLTLDMTPTWGANLRRLIARSDPSTCFPLNIRTSAPIPAWSSSTVTLLGDAIHTMTPGRGVGANTALRDAALLCRNLTDARDGGRPLVEAIHDYEAQMIDYGFHNVLTSRQQMDGHGVMHRPYVGRAMLAAMRTGMRVVNHLPPVKRRVADQLQRSRGAGRRE